MSDNKAHAKIIRVAHEMLDGKINLLDGCRIITGLHSRAYKPEDDIFMPFRAVDSETDHWPLGVSRELCDTEYLKRVDSEIELYLELESEYIKTACRNVIKKLSKPLTVDDSENQ